MSFRFMPCLLAATLLIIPVHAQELPLVTVPRMAAAPVMDGAVGDSFRRHAAVLGPLLRPDGKGVPAAATRAWIARTDTDLLLGIDCAEPLMNHIVATHRDRDSEVWTDDCVEVFVQPPGKPYFHFIVNAIGTQLDEQGQDTRWNANWQAAVHRGTDRWAVMIALPWEAFGGRPRDNTAWRLNVCRSRRPQLELSCWSPTGGGFHVPERFGVMRFADAPVPVDAEWTLPSRHVGRVHVAWEPAAAGEQVDLRVNGAPAAGSFLLSHEGWVPLVLEAKRKSDVIYRAVFGVEISPIQAELAAAQREIARIGTDVRGIQPAREALRQRLADLGKRAAAAPPSAADELLNEIEQVGVQASHLAVKAQMMQAGQRPQSITYGIETSLLKLLRHEPFHGQSSGVLRLDAARREMDAKQLVLFAFDKPLTAVSVRVGDAKGERGHLLPASAFRVRHVGYVPTTKPSYKVDYVGLWPDPLLPLTPFDVAPEQFETLWVDVRVPAGTSPGIYRGAITLSAGNAAATTVPVEVRVRNFTIPVHPSLRTAFGLGPSYKIPQDTDAYVRDLLEHRVSPYSVGTPKLLKAPALDWHDVKRMDVEITSDRDGILSLNVVSSDNGSRTVGSFPVKAGNAQVSFDLTASRGIVNSWRLQLIGPSRATATVRLVRDSGAQEIVHQQQQTAVAGEDSFLQSWLAWEGSGWDDPAIPAQWDWSEFDSAMARYLPIGLTGQVASIRDPRAGWARAWEQHLREHGWLKLAYTYLFDEPRPEDYPKLNRVMGEVKRAAPGIMNMMTARAFPPELHYVDIWCPELYSFNPEAARAEQAKGKAVWWYVAFSTRHPYPDVWIDYPALDCHVWPWMTWKHNIDGMLYWSTTYWSRSDPWKSGETFPGANGDGSLLYPGQDGKPVDSIRWECLRDGLEDYEVFCLLDAGVRELTAKHIRPDLIRKARPLLAIDDHVVRSYKDYNPDPHALLNARRQMSDLLEQMVKVLGHEPKIEGRPRFRPGVDPAQVPPEPQPAVASTQAVKWTPPALTPEPGLVLRYAFDDQVPFAFDLSGTEMHGLMRDVQRAPSIVGNGLRFTFDRHSAVILPAGSALLGTEPSAGTIAVWAKPSFNPKDLETDLWHGYRVLFYIMQTDGNGLPDGYDEIGVYVHGNQLLARCAGREGAFASVPSPLRAGEWSHICLTWNRERRALFVNGKLVAEAKRQYPLPKLDNFAGRLGNHPASNNWSWDGELDDFRIYRRCLTDAEVAALATR